MASLSRQYKLSFQFRSSLSVFYHKFKQAFDNSKALAVPHNLPDAWNTQANRGINATQKRKLTEVSDTEPSLFPLYRVRRKLAAFLTSFYKSNTVLKLTSAMLYPILETSLAEKGCSTAGSCWTKTIYLLERLTTSGTWYRGWSEIEQMHIQDYQKSVP